MIKIAVCDDEKKVLEEISSYIEKFMKREKKKQRLSLMVPKQKVSA